MTAQELKNSILQLAIQGKLVEQRPDEGTAEELYRRIQSEKAKLLKAGKIKKEKPLPEITEDEIPFEIPETWKWVRLGECTNYGQSKIKIKAADISPDTWSLDLEDIEKETGRIIARIPAQKRKIIGDKVVFHKGEILYSKLRPYLKKILIADNDGICSSEIVPFTQYSNIATLYLLYFLKSPHVDYVINSVTYGVKMPRVGSDTMLNLLVPLPPLEEQKRIVAKIEEIFPYIERFGELRSQLRSISEDLRKSILQQAIQGKLVEQYPNDEPASKLLERIRAKKERLIKAGKIKKEKPLPPITEEEMPFEIPENWAWERIGNLFSVIRGSSPRPKGSPLYWSPIITEYNWITIKDISDYTQDGFLQKTHEYLTEAGAKLSTFVDRGELIIAVSGSTTGKFCRLGIRGYIYDGLAAILNPQRIISGDYLNVFFSWAYQILNSQKIGSAFPNINTDVLKNTLIPIPPLAEQQRIVVKIEELLKLCDKLK